ncbi:TIGR00180 family glycosyltransferase [Opitutales bacterium]|nr:TIGR00180 family glycosyltransferase [Opitutales bacterium]
MRNLKELTILVPSFDRPHFLKRLLSYWSGRGPKIIVADGSARPIDSNSLSCLKSNIEYHHLRNLEVQKRISFLVSRAKSKYTMLHADDEFFMPSSLNTQIEYLECQDDLIACMGHSIAFKALDQYLISNIVYPELINYEINADFSHDRMVFHMKHYSPSLIYSVAKTEFWKAAFKLATNGKKFSFWAGGEILVEMALAYLGKSKVINTLGWLRSKENKRIEGKQAHERHSSRFTTWWESAEMENERELFIQLFAEKMSAVDGRPISVIKEEAWEGLNSYYGFSKNYHAGKHWFNRPETTVEPITDLAEKLVGSGVSVNLEELQEIKQIVMEFHSKTFAKAG